MIDKDFVLELARSFSKKVAEVRKVLGRPLTLTEKILYTHLHEDSPLKEYKRGVDYVYFKPDRVAMQDATAQMALLQFILAEKSRVAVPTSVHCDHLIQAKDGADIDLDIAEDTNKEVYDFLASCAARFGIGYWRPGAGIIHQIVYENYSFPGGMIIGTDSHTVNAGGMGMVAIGVGGADAVDVMVGMPWELKMPKMMGVRLKGTMRDWTSPKDVILKLLGKLSVKGGTGFIIEYFGLGAKKMSSTGKATICNMGAELGATTSIFGYDENSHLYLRATGRGKLAAIGTAHRSDFTGDKACYMDPMRYFDRFIEINLTNLEPHINGPFTPDKAWAISKFKKNVLKHGFPEKLSVGLIGSCTNSSYEDLTRAASVAKQAKEKGLVAKAEFTITPGSEQIRYTIERDGLIDTFSSIGGMVLANACGPCIGQWNRAGAEKQEKNSIITSFNRNFAKRADGNPNTYAFVASPEIVTAMVLGGSLTFNPLRDTITNVDGVEVKLDPPKGEMLPKKGFDVERNGYMKPPRGGGRIEIRIRNESERLQRLKPFEPLDNEQLKGMRLLIKAKGKCTTDHISMAGPWLKYRGHLENISGNCYIGAVNYFNGATNKVYNSISGEFLPVPESAKLYKANNIGTVIFGEENLGEGSSREHAAMEPRFLGVKAVIVKSFARIHETNLKKQGMIALTFVNPEDYNKVRQDDIVDIIGFDTFAPGENMKVVLNHSDKTKEEFEVSHSYSQQQIDWVKAGSALNLIRQNNEK